MEHNAENLVLIWRTCDELRVGKKYRLILSSEGALYAEYHELFEADLCLPLPRVVRSHDSHFKKI